MTTTGDFNFIENKSVEVMKLLAKCFFSEIYINKTI